MGGSSLWRTIGFITVYGFAAVAVTIVFWQSPQPTADRSTTLGTTSRSTGTSPTDELPTALRESAQLTDNSAYGIKGSVSFPNAATVLVHDFSLIARGPKVQLELRDATGNTVALLKDVSQLTLTGEDLVLALPLALDLFSVASFAVVAPDYNLVLSRAEW